MIESRETVIIYGFVIVGLLFVATATVWIARSTRGRLPFWLGVLAALLPLYVWAPMILEARLHSRLLTFDVPWLRPALIGGSLHVVGSALIVFAGLAATGSDGRPRAARWRALAITLICALGFGAWWWEIRTIRTATISALEAELTAARAALPPGRTEPQVAAEGEDTLGEIRRIVRSLHADPSLESLEEAITFSRADRPENFAWPIKGQTVDLDSSRSAIAELRLAATGPWPVGTEVHGESPRGPSNWRDLHDLKSAAAVLAASSEQHGAHSDREDALADAVAVLALTRGIADQPDLLRDGLNTLDFVDALATRSLRGFLSKGRVETDELDRLGRIDDIDYVSLHANNLYISNVGNTRRLLSRMKSGASIANGGPLIYPDPFGMRELIMVPYSLEWGQSSVDQAIRLAKERATGRSPHSHESEPSDTSGSPTDHETHLLRQHAQRTIAHLDGLDRATTRRRLLRIVVALHRHHLRVGHFPTSLSELAPGEFHELPTDPVTARSFLFEVTDSGWHLSTADDDPELQWQHERQSLENRENRIQSSPKKSR